MGAVYSLHDDNEDGKQIGRNAEQIDGAGSGSGSEKDSLTGSGAKNRFTRLFRGVMWKRIILVTLLGCFIGLGIPLILYYADKPSGPRPIYGSCLIKNEYRFKCLINQLAEPTEDECINAMCCWENNATLSFQCYHSFNPAYQYHVVSSSSSPGDPDADVEDECPGQGQQPDGCEIEIALKPNHEDRMTKLVTKLVWVSPEHLNIQFFDPDLAVPPKSPKALPKARTGDFSQDSFNVSFSDEADEFFYIRIGRNANGTEDETIFDTRIGPIVSVNGGKEISFATLLPTQYFYGLKGGQGGGPTIYEVIHGLNNMDLPFYLPLETSGKVHGVFFETAAPFLVHFIEAPALLFHFEGPTLAITMHLFIGPTVKDVSRQLRSYLSALDNVKELQKPPYWALGLHLCQQMYPGENPVQQIAALQRNISNGFPPIPYDSHCIDQNIRTPFEVDQNNYNVTELDKIFQLLSTKRTVLAQKIGLRPDDYSADSPAYFINSADENVLVGLNDGLNVIYPNFHHEDSGTWLANEVQNVNMTFVFESATGLVLINNFPISENSNKTCPSPYGDDRKRTRLEQKFLSDGRDGLVCPEAIHYLDDLSSESKSHFEVHNEYGHEVLMRFKPVLVDNVSPHERVLITTASVRPNSYFHGGFSGLTVPFTWNGMVDTLAHLLRNFMFFAYAGTPICGNYLPADGPSRDNELCLRWFQLGLLLPFARNTFGKNITSGPLDFNMNDQKNLIDAIQERYRYTPYYYTLFHTYEDSGEPPIRPMVYDFHEEPAKAFQTLTQFMIGPAVLAAPILSKAATTREAYFPAGTWYEITGAFVFEDFKEGKLLTIPGLPSMTPMFLRGGHVIPTFTTPEAGSAEESRSGAYTILATYPRTDPENEDNDNEEEIFSTGFLYVDDGVTINSTFDTVEFEVSNRSIIIKSNCGLDMDQNGRLISRNIDQIKIFGFPPPIPSIKTNIPDQIRPQVLYSEDDLILRIRTFNFNWCEFDRVEFTWIYEYLK